jgi:hypothetical protein
VLSDVAPRYWPSLRFLARIPGLREVAMWNCVVLIKKTSGAPVVDQRRDVTTFGVIDAQGRGERRGAVS